MCDSAQPLSTVQSTSFEVRESTGADERTLYLKFPSLEDPTLRHMQLVLRMFPGKSRVKMVMADTRKVYAGCAQFHPALIEEAKEALGEENVVVK